MCSKIDKMQKILSRMPSTLMDSVSLLNFIHHYYCSVVVITFVPLTETCHRTYYIMLTLPIYVLRCSVRKKLKLLLQGTTTPPFF